MSMDIKSWAKKYKELKELMDRYNIKVYGGK